MYNNIVSSATRKATLTTVKGKSYIVTMTGEVSEKLSKKTVANGTNVKGWVTGTSEFAEIKASAPYDRLIGPDMFAHLTAIKGAPGNILRIAVDAEDDNPMLVKCHVAGVTITGVDNDGSDSTKIELELLPYEAKFAKATVSGSKNTKLQKVADGGDDVETTSSTIAQILSPDSNSLSSIAGLIQNFTI